MKRIKLPTLPFGKRRLASSAGTSVFAALIIAIAGSMVPVRAAGDNGHYLIDFGDDSQKTTATGWNNVPGSKANDTTTLYNLVDSTGAASTSQLRISDGFNCQTGYAPVNTTGATNSTRYPASATRDSLYLGVTGNGSCNQNDTTAAFTLTGMPAGTYEVRFYASRTGVSDNRSADYSIGTTKVTLNAAGNVNNYVAIPNVAVTSGGGFTATMTKSSLSTYYSYLGVVEIVQTASGGDNGGGGGTNSAPTVNAGTDQTITLPSHSVTLNGSATDPDGTIASYQWSEVTSGGSTIVSPGSASTTVTDLAAGTYTFRLTATDNQGSSATDDVNVVVQPNNVTSCGPQKIAVLGSSTAAGTGASPSSKSWVNLYASYLHQLNASNSVVNLAVSGYSTYEEMPTGFNTPANRPSVDTAHNVTAAIAAHPNAIIINLPSNDTANGESVSEIESNYQTMIAAATQAGIPVWISTPQPRDDGFTTQQHTDLMTIRDWITNTYGDNSFDFWSGLATAEGGIISTYGAGDGIHLNNLGHQKLYNRVVGSNLIDTLCSGQPSQPPFTISAVADTPVVSQTISWTTSAAASSKVEYGTSTGYGSNTPETDTGTRVTSHSVTLTGLTACTTYHYRVHSTDASGHEQVGDDTTFKTLCSSN